MSITLDPVVAEHVIVPLGDRILVETQGAVDEQKVGMLIIPKSAEDAKVWGTVVGVGPDFQVRDDQEQSGEEPWIVKLGDRVLYARYGGNDIELPDGRKLLFLREDDVIAKIGPRKSEVADG